MTKSKRIKAIEKIRGRAISNLCAYTPDTMPVMINASDLKKICDLALKQLNRKKKSKLSKFLEG